MRLFAGVEGIEQTHEKLIQDLQTATIWAHQRKLLLYGHINGNCYYMGISMETVTMWTHQWKLLLYGHINGNCYHMGTSMETVTIWAQQ